MGNLSGPMSCPNEIPVANVHCSNSNCCEVTPGHSLSSSRVSQRKGGPNKTPSRHAGFCLIFWGEPLFGRFKGKSTEKPPVLGHPYFVAPPSAQNHVDKIAAPRALPLAARLLHLHPKKKTCQSLPHLHPKQKTCQGLPWRTFGFFATCKPTCVFPPPFVAPSIHLAPIRSSGPGLHGAPQQLQLRLHLLGLAGQWRNRRLVRPRIFRKTESSWPHNNFAS